MPAFYSEPFTGSNGANVTTLSGFSKHPQSGARNLLLADNRVYSDSNAGVALYINSAVPPSADYSVRGQFHRRSTEASSFGVLGRLDPVAQTAYMPRYNTTSGALELFRFNGGTATAAPSTYTVAFPVGTSLDYELWMRGNLIEVWIVGEGAPRISWTDPNPLTAAGFIGLRSFAANSATTGIHLDLIEATDLQVAGAMQAVLNCAPYLSARLTVPAPESAWYDGAWSRRCAVSIPGPKLSGALTDFQALIRIDDEPELALLAQRNGADILFTTEGGTKLAHEVIDYWAGLSREAGWVWFVRPSALRYVGTFDRTFVSYQKNDGAIALAQYDHTAEEWAEPFDLHAPGDTTNLFVQEDHGPSAILVRASDKRLLTFYAGHAGPQLFMRVSASPEDATAWADEIDLDAQLGGAGYSYPSPVQFADGTIWLFFRATAPNDGSPTDWFYSQSADGGATWSAGVKFWNNSGYGYIGMAQHGDTIYFVANPDHPRWLASNSTYTFKYIHGTGWQTMADAGITLPAAPGTTTLLYNGASADGRSWLWDIAVGEDGHPRVAYARLGDTDNHKMHWARWTGSAWDDHLVVNSGKHIGSMNPDNASFDDPWYSGGIAFDHDDPNTVYVSRTVSGVQKIYRYTTADNGASFTPAAITTGSKHRNFRPVCPRNHHAALELFWRYGPQPDYTRHLTAVTMYPLTKPRVQELSARVRVSALAASGYNWMWMYWGNPAAAPQEDRAGTYPSTWRMVWNGREDYGGDAAKASDSTGNTTLTKGANNRPYEARGSAVREERFDGSDQINVSGLNMAGWSEVTVLSHGNWAGTPTGDEHMVFANWSNTKAGIILRIDPTAANQVEAFARTAGDVQKGGTSSLAVTPGVYQTIGMAYRNADGITVRRGKSTVLLAGSAGGGTLDADASANGAIGRYNTDHVPGESGAEYYNGRLAAAWIADTWMPPAWQDAWHDNLAAPKAFVQFGMVEAGLVLKAVADDGSGFDAPNIGVTLGLADAGAGNDVLIPAAQVPLSDAGAGTDALTLAALAAVADVGAGADAVGTITVSIAVGDSAVGADALDVITAILIAVGDTAAGVDAVAGVSSEAAVADAGAGTDALVAAVRLALSDSASGADAVAVLQATLVAIADAATGADAVSVAVRVPLSEAGTGADAVSITALLQVIEAAGGADTVLRFSVGAARIATIAFSLVRRQVQFAFARRTVTFTLNA